MKAKELVINGMRYGTVSACRKVSDNWWFAMKNGIEIKIPLYMILDTYENYSEIIFNLHDILKTEKTESEG